jgi:hypothetical protein
VHVARGFGALRRQLKLGVAFDEGFIVVGDRRQPLTEVELELKAGEGAALYDFAAIPLALPPSEWSRRSDTAAVCQMYARF